MTTNTEGYKMEINCDSNRLFTANGTYINPIEQDGDTVIYNLAGMETIGTIGQDVFTIHQLTDLTAVLRALRSAEGRGNAYTAPKYSVRVGKRVFAYFNGRLSAVVFKQRGRTPNFVRITIEEAHKLASDRFALYYTKGTNSWVIKDKLAKN